MIKCEGDRKGRNLKGAQEKRAKVRLKIDYRRCLGFAADMLVTGRSAEEKNVNTKNYWK